MSTNLISLVARNHEQQSENNQSMFHLLVPLLILLIAAVLLVASLLFLRYRRQANKKDGLPTYNEKRLSIASTASDHSSHRRILIRPSESIHVYQEKQHLIENSFSPPPSPVPEIRITFPEEVDASGKRQLGRVLVVRVGDTTVGLEPVSQDKLPAYQQAGGERLQSLDLDRIGGLVENETVPQWR